MKNILKYFLPIAAIFYFSVVMGATPGFDALGSVSGYYYHKILPSSLSGTGAQNMLFNIFFVLASFLFIIAVIVAFFAAIRLLTSDNSEEDFSKWSNTLIWSVLGLLLVALSYGFMRTLSNALLDTGGTELNVDTIYDVTVSIIYPILNFLRYIAAICFFIVLVYAFYTIIFSGGNEEGFQNGKRIFITASLGFVLMLLAEPIVRMVYGGSDCGGDKLFGIATECTNREFDTSIFFETVIKIIIFLNGFIALVTLIMIMYAGFLVLTGGGDEEKSEKAKKTITYAVIGMLMILFSYVIYRAFLFNVA